MKSVDDKVKIVKVAAAPAGRVPMFQSAERAPLHDRLVAEMRAVYRDTAMPAFLDAIAQGLLSQARATYAALDLDRRSVVREGDELFVFPWRGTFATTTLRLAFAREELAAESDRLGLQFSSCSAEQFPAAVKAIAAHPPTSQEIAAQLETLRTQKFDELIPEALLRVAYAKSSVDLSAVRQMSALAVVE